MRVHHEHEWTSTVLKERLKGWELLAEPSATRAPTGSGQPREPFTLEGFIDRLGAVIVENDLVSAVLTFQSRPELTVVANALR